MHASPPTIFIRVPLFKFVTPLISFFSCLYPPWVYLVLQKKTSESLHSKKSSKNITVRRMCLIIIKFRNFLLIFLLYRFAKVKPR